MVTPNLDAVRGPRTKHYRNKLILAASSAITQLTGLNVSFWQVFHFSSLSLQLLLDAITARRTLFVATILVDSLQRLFVLIVGRLLWRLIRLPRRLDDRISRD